MSIISMIEIERPYRMDCRCYILELLFSENIVNVVRYRIFCFISFVLFKEDSYIIELTILFKYYNFLIRDMTLISRINNPAP